MGMAGRSYAMCVVVASIQVCLHFGIADARLGVQTHHKVCRSGPGFFSGIYLDWVLDCCWETMTCFYLGCKTDRLPHAMFSSSLTGKRQVLPIGLSLSNRCHADETPAGNCRKDHPLAGFTYISVNLQEAPHLRQHRTETRSPEGYISPVDDPLDQSQREKIMREERRR